MNFETLGFERSYLSSGGRNEMKQFTDRAVQRGTADHSTASQPLAEKMTNFSVKKFFFAADV